MSIYLLNKITIFILCIFYGIEQIHSQGCTDPLANNYDLAAIQNDGSCTYDPVLIAPINTYSLNTKISETSGLIFWNDKLWTHNDNSDINLYEIAPSNGSIMSSISLDSEINNDWEEISQDEDYVYIGDFGNNVNGNRTDLKILKVTKSSILEGIPQIEIINFTYEDQIDFSAKGANNTNYDCEAFIITEDYIFLFTKQWLSNETRVYKLPKIPGTHQAVLLDVYNIKGLVTGAVYNNEKGIIALSGYTNFLQPFIFLLYEFTGNNFFGANKRRLDIDLPFYQVEAISTSDGLTYYISNESFETTGTTQQLHILDLKPYLEK